MRCGFARSLGAPGGGTFRAHPKIVPSGRGAKRHPRPRDGCVIALLGGAGAWHPRHSEWGEVSEDPRGALGQARAESRPKIVPAGQGAQSPGPPRRVCYNLSGGRGGVASAGLRMGRSFARGLMAPERRRVQIPTQR